mgnify:CR=1 FL=1
MNKVGLIIQVKSFVIELRKQTFWETKGEHTVWQWILKYKPSAAFTHSREQEATYEKLWWVTELIRVQQQQ